MRPKLVLIVSTVLTLSGCASLPDSCRPFVNSPGDTKYAIASDDAGIEHAARLDTPELQCLSDQGNRAAMVELGRRLETDAGSAGAAKAIELYRRAATPVAANTAIYSPPVTLGGRGQLIVLTNPGATAGSAEAKYRLGTMYLDGRGLAADQERGWSLIREAAVQGFAPAIEALARQPGR